MALREDAERAYGDWRDRGPGPHDAVSFMVGYEQGHYAALAVMAAEHSRRIEVALGRINEVRVRLDKPLPYPAFEQRAELRCSLLAAMTELQGMLSAEKASVWAAKLERAP